MKYLQPVVAITTLLIPAIAIYTGAAEAVDVGSTKHLTLDGLFLANAQGVTLSGPSPR